jgi:hypothetical protein
MRQRKVVIGLLVVAALSLGLVPSVGNAGPEKAWACAAVWNPVPGGNQCTTTSTIKGGGLYYGTVDVYVNNVKVWFNNSPSCYHFSTLPLPPGPGCKELKDIGPGTVKAVATGSGSFVVVGSRGD